MGIVRLSGLASGMDTEKIISDLLKAERVPLDKTQQKKQTVIWQRDDYRSMNTLYSSFRSLTDQLRLSATFAKKQAVSGNESVVTAQAGSNASDGSYTVKVDQLASPALVAGGTGVGYTQTASTTGDFKITGSGGTKTITVTSSSTTQSIMDDINKANIGIKASYDSVNSRVILSTAKSGTSESISIDDTISGSLNGNLKIDTTAVPVKGKDAQIELNGTPMTMGSNSLSFNGINFNFKGTTTSAIAVSVSQDTESVVGKIKDFVAKYNEVVDSVMGKVSEKHDRNYEPLTTEQKDAMSDKQVELWESKAKTGLLANDSILQSGLTTLRNSLMGKVQGLPANYDSLSDIGITVKKDWKENGKLDLDINKLTDALTADPDSFQKLFTQSSSKPTTDPTRKSELGFAERLSEDLNLQITRVSKKIGFGTNSELVDSSILGQQIKGMNETISKYEDRLSMTEQRYRKQFTAMEKALQNLNSQSSWLSSQLGN
ncbi:flagellar filament capping protein FliD [Paenibacillus aceris]|uniref:Flagellar hook-associated protein 2 n=1 Tax=Paenibacillus aceris TaxID=869555 RepID=A0ABS4I4Q0_9BACL|nr:flagellar filament capping protein FliD [Paenibacillus aceris]MBP1965805.1 flagellar hook-associated protein 2 [Paenibacillus aceris]NHW34849.1 flagellar filament capping protein FliD [Paenibacillus aceris]